MGRRHIILEANSSDSMPPRKKRKTTKKSNPSKTAGKNATETLISTRPSNANLGPGLPSSSPGDKETSERHQMLLRQMIDLQEQRQPNNNITQSPVDSQPTDRSIESPSSSQPTNHYAETPTSSKVAYPVPGSPEAKQPINDPMAGARDTPSPSRGVIKRRRASPTPLPTFSPTVQDDTDDSWLGRPVTAQQATVNPSDDTFEIVDIRFSNRERILEANVCWEDGTTAWLEIESIMNWAKDQVRCHMNFIKELILLIRCLALHGHV